jgi:hypothetical protein
MNCDEREYGYYFRERFGVMKIIGMVLGGIVLAVVMGFAFGYFVMLLWNWLMPIIFGLKAITFWQAFGIVVLAKILFGGHGMHGYDHGRGYRRKHRHMYRNDWAPRGDYGNWRYYDDYWKNEGKAAFDAYLERIKGGEKQ